MLPNPVFLRITNKQEKMNDKIDEKDEEDVLECDCYLIFCIATNGKIYFDRVYRTKELAQKRVNYLNLISDGRGHWRYTFSQLGN
jgi:hypothetical protein